jgi:hypothetical protein
VTAPRSATHINPYSADGRTSTYDVAVAAGADPLRNSDAGTPPGAGGRWDNNGWSPTITRDDYGGIADPTRTGELPRYDARANLRNPWAWWTRRNADVETRESVTVQDANGFEERKGYRTRAPHPLWSPPPESRPTQALSPHSYYFERPFDQEIARQLTGAHISLANNRRNYEILIQTPVPHRRNTYRVEPSPWDTDIVDEAPSATAGRPSERLQQPPITAGMVTRSYRLG